MGKHAKRGAGGYRPGAGAKKGVPKVKRIASVRNLAIANKVIDDLKDHGAQTAELPLERMLRRMNDPRVDEDTKDTLAGMAAPFVHAKLSNVAHSLRPGQAAVGPDGKAAEASLAKAGKITVTMKFDNPGEIKE